MPRELQPDMQASLLEEKLASLKFHWRQNVDASTPARANSDSESAASPAAGAARSGGDHQSPNAQSPRGVAAADAVVNVAVRCRPLSKPTDPSFGISSVSRGQDKVSLKLTIPEGAVDYSSPRGEDGRPARLRDEPRILRCNAYCGPAVSQEEFFENAVPVVDHALEGNCGSLLFYGISGAGKTYSMFGPPESGLPRDAASDGVAQRAVRHICRHMDNAVVGGAVFVVEATCLQIYSEDGTQEQLVDLLADEERPLEVKQDPLNLKSFVCQNLRRMPIQNPDDVREVVSKSRRRRAAVESSRGWPAERSHCLLVLTVETLSQSAGCSTPMVRRGKLVLADLAGSETLAGGARASSSGDEHRKRQQAIGVNRTFASLSNAMSGMSPGAAPGQGESALLLLLRDCLGGKTRSLLVANIGLQIEDAGETVRTLTFAQQLMSSRSLADRSRLDQEQNSLLQMRQRHTDCIRLLQESVSDTRGKEEEERLRIQKEMEELASRMKTKETADKSVDQLQDEQFKKIDEMRQEMTQAMKRELERMRQQSVQDFSSLRNAVERSVDSLDLSNQERQLHDNEALVGKLQAELQEALQSQRTLETEASNLRVRLASSEERARMLQERQEELRRERSTFDEEKKALRQQAEEQWQKLTTVAGELHQFKAEAEVQRTALEQLNAARAEGSEAMRKEREEWRAQEAELQKRGFELRGSLEEARRDAQLQALRVESEQREAASQLRIQLQRLEAEAASSAEQLAQAGKQRQLLEVERAASQQREEALRQQSAQELRQCREELEEAKVREAELIHMLKEVQDSIITLSADGEGVDAEVATVALPASPTNSYQSGNRCCGV